MTHPDVRPFRVDLPEEATVDLRRRIAATRLPDKETVADQPQGVQSATMRELARYWPTDYDWRKVEARLNALPQFVTEIDGLDIHFIHVRSPHADTVPLIVTCGWPSSVIEHLKIIDPLTDPTARGGRAEDAFHLVIPSLSGYGLCEEPQTTGWNAARIARARDTLMKRLGYGRYVAQSGGCGAFIAEVLARLVPEGLPGSRLNLRYTRPPEIAKSLRNGDPVPAGLSKNGKAAYEQVRARNATGPGYIVMMGTRPQAIGYSLAAWIIGHDERNYAHIARAFDGHPGGLTPDDVLDNVTFYWLTGTDRGTRHAALPGGYKSRRPRPGRHRRSRCRDSLPRRDLPKLRANAVRADLTCTPVCAT
jgi:hypothetical protein